MEELQYLQDTGEISEDVVNLFPHTTGKVSESKNGPNPSPPKVLESTLKILEPPQIMVVKENPVPRTYKELVADCGDELVVFGWTACRTQAIAYNARTQRAGRFPADKLDTRDSKSFVGWNLCIAQDKQIPRSIVDCIGWSAGDYIIVWDRKEGKHCMASGFGFNRATGAIGKFETTSFYLQTLPKTEKHSK
jgi:hypothetical protein